MNEYKSWLKQNGYCINCCKEKTFNGKTMCAECLDIAKERSETTRTENSREQRRRYIKRKRDICIAFGICRECLKRNAKVGLKCVECYAKELQRRERTRKEVKRNMRVELGLCYFCGDPVVEGYKTCNKHLKIQGNKFRNWHIKNGDNSNHIWRKIQGGEIKNIKYYRENMIKK